jgi:hypothetical protein
MKKRLKYHRWIQCHVGDFTTHIENSDLEGLITNTETHEEKAKILQVDAMSCD